MSGPKLSELLLMAERRRVIAQERRRNNRIVCAALSEIRKRAEQVGLRAFRLGDSRDEMLGRIKDLERAAIDHAMALGSTDYPDDPIASRLFNDRLEDRLGKLVQGFVRDLDFLCDGWQLDAAGIESVRALERIAQAVRGASTSNESGEEGDLAATRVHPKRSLSVTDVASENGEVPVRWREDLIDEAGRSLAELQRLVMSPATPAASKPQIMTIAESIGTALSRYRQAPSNPTPLENALRAASPEIFELVRKQRGIQALIDECRVLAAQVSAVTGVETKLPELGEMDAGEMSDLIEALHGEVQEALEEAYVAHAMDEVMARHGYPIRRAVRLQEVKDADHSLYLNEGTDVGIHAYRGEGGLVMMETASVDEAVRQGADGQVVERGRARTAVERARLFGEQEGFCSLYPQIVEDLKAYGITIARMSDMEPDESTSMVISAVRTVTGDETPARTDDLRRRRAVGREVEREAS